MTEKKSFWSSKAIRSVFCLKECKIGKVSKVLNQIATRWREQFEFSRQKIAFFIVCDLIFELQVSFLIKAQN